MPPKKTIREILARMPVIANHLFSNSSLANRSRIEKPGSERREGRSVPENRHLS